MCNCFPQIKYRLINTAGVIEKSISDFSNECKESSHFFLSRARSRLSIFFFLLFLVFTPLFQCISSSFRFLSRVMNKLMKMKWKERILKMQ